MYIGTGTSVKEPVNLKDILIDRLKKPELVERKKEGYEFTLYGNMIQVVGGLGTAACYVSGIPSQCGAAAIHGMYNGSDDSFKELIIWIEEILVAMNYTVMFASHTIAMKNTLEKLGMKEIYSFRNKRSENRVYFLIKELQ